MDSFDFSNDGDVGFVEDFLTQELYDSYDFERGFSSERDDFWDDDCESDEYDEYDEDTEYVEEPESDEEYICEEISSASAVINNISANPVFEHNNETISKPDESQKLIEKMAKYQKYLAEKSEKLAKPEEIITIIKPDKSEYPNKRRYRAAYLLAEDISGYKSNKQIRKQHVRSRFILNNADMIPAADYLTHDTGFLYAQAIKENFDLPFELQDEDRQRIFEFPNLLKKLGKREPELALEVWHWCLLTFLPFAQYDDNAQNDLINMPLKNVYNMPREFQKAFQRYKEEHIDFAEMLGKSNETCKQNVLEDIAEK